ncbi:hypothetical protein [Paludibacterium sp. THUN1379]|uniref:hypothetical protein n=1 Tax=Paludibacterium sp. THUN1379 TaxID=3112107 RepID=UPI0030D145D5
MFPEDKHRSHHDMPFIIAGVVLIALAFSVAGQLPRKALLFVAAILLAIGLPWVGGPLLLYLIFKR